MTQSIKFQAMPTELVDAYRNGKPDANGLAPASIVSDGDGNPCRHCLQDIAEGERMLELSYRPFDSIQAYAETGPIFLHADGCERRDENARLAQMFLKREEWLLRGYCADDRIVPGTGKVVTAAQTVTRAQEILNSENVEYVHVRSASNNCYQCRIEPA